MELYFAWCYVPPISQDCLDARGAKALSANSNRHYCFPGCQHNPGSLLLYSWGGAGRPIPRDLSCSFPANPASPQKSSALIKMIWQPKSRLAKRQLRKDKQISSKPPTYKQEPRPHWAATHWCQSSLITHEEI